MKIQYVKQDLEIVIVKYAYLNAFKVNRILFCRNYQAYVKSVSHHTKDDLTIYL